MKPSNFKTICVKVRLGTVEEARRRSEPYGVLYAPSEEICTGALSLARRERYQPRRAQRETWSLPKSWTRERCWERWSIHCSPCPTA